MPIKYRCLSSFTAIAAASAAIAAPIGKATGTTIRALAVSAEAREQMERYSLKALENGDVTNTVRGLVFTPKGGAARPMIVYIPGNGEIGDVAAALMLIVPILCGFHASSHAAWMMDNTVPRFAWYVLAVSLGALARCAVTQRSSGAEGSWGVASDLGGEG